MSEETLTQTLAPGVTSPLGAHLTGAGVNFAIYAGHATAMELVIFDVHGDVQIASYGLHHGAGGVWHGLLPGAGAGIVYGLRAYGPAAPHQGHCYQPELLLLDPYARALAGKPIWVNPTVHGGGNVADNAALMCKARVVSDADFDWGDDAAPRTPMADTVLYEVHVKGITQLHPGVPEEQKGRYLGLASGPMIEHYRRLGITAINLLPVHHHVDEGQLVRQGKVNYWGYNTLAFFAPDDRFALRDPRAEFRQMVQTLHRAGIEVILDVVYNHTAEGSQSGPTLSWRGLDNDAYYWLCADDRSQYENFSGCGNTLNLTQPAARAMVLDSLRYWVEHMHVDGFRFDLATILGRTADGFDAHSDFFTELARDPVLADTKLIAEPWDIGPGGYCLGRFAAPWAEWNDQYRRAARAYWLQTSDRAHLASCLTGSSQIFASSARPPQASINYLCSHDGFTLADLTSYNRKRNQANGENNRDGSNDNQSWNCGHEGPSELLGVVNLRMRLRRAMLATLFLSRGVPMLMAGDELGRTQQGNNNAYCHDNELTWLAWPDADQSMIDFTARLSALRREFEQLRGTNWLRGVDATVENGVPTTPQVQWLDTDARPMHRDAWHDKAAGTLGMLLDGARPLLAIFNARAVDGVIRLPAGRWQWLMDTGLAEPFDSGGRNKQVEREYWMSGRAVIVFEQLQ